jgi:pyridoxamine 5'-phosphate oxidase
MSDLNLADLRREYIKNGLLESDIDKDPFRQFSLWFEQASNAGIMEPNAMSHATVSPDGQPSMRVVLLKGVDDKGFIFFTNYESRKGKDIELNPKSSLLFFWGELERQVRIEGTIEKISQESSKAYFDSRPEGSRIGAWSSDQSTIVASRDVLESRFDENMSRFAGKDIPMPDYWGGYRLVPTMLEFWQGRGSRMHDRIRYRLVDNTWLIDRLSP